MKRVFPQIAYLENSTVKNVREKRLRDSQNSTVKKRFVTKRLRDSQNSTVKKFVREGFVIARIPP
jgi:hypothetical protein